MSTWSPPAVVSWLVFIALAGCSNKLGAADTDGSGDPDTDVVDTDTGPIEDDADLDSFTESQGDCDDNDPTVYPGAPEECNGKDDDCDGKTDDDFDEDHDGVADCEDTCPIYVDVHATAGLQNGTITDPFLAIQDGIDAAAALNCSIIYVKAGDYEESVDFLGQDLLVQSVDGPVKTQIIGDGARSVVTFANAESIDAVLRGFRITEGGGAHGAGIYVNGADPLIEGNDFIDNRANSGDQQGGGVFLFDSDAVVRGNTFSFNDAGYGGLETGNDGGGMFVRGGAPQIDGNTFIGNTAGDGGAMWFARSDALVVSNLIVENEAYDQDPVKGGQGGGVDVQIGTSEFYFAGNLVLSNIASTHGGGVAVYEYADTEGDPWIVNNTFAWNVVTDTDYGSAFVGWSTTHSHVVNNIFYDNSGVAVWLNSTTFFAYNDLYANTTNLGGDQPGALSLNGNIATDPRFTNVTDDSDEHNDDWTLRSNSACRNAGDPTIFDLDGSRSDVGASGGAYAW